MEFYMKASYEISKIKAMVLYILKESGGTLDFITLFKNMYFSQREFLVKFGRPLFKDSFRAVKLGPVPSFTYAAFGYALLMMGLLNLELANFPLKLKDYPSILDYDSWLDCSQLFRIAKKKVLSRGEFCGNIIQSDWDLILPFLRETEAISNKEKREFGIIQ